MTYKVNDLAIGYKGKAILEGIDLEFDAIGLVYLHGENGSGKSTFIKTITGNLKPIRGDYAPELEKALYLIQDADLISKLDGYENILLIANQDLDDKEVYEKAEVFGIAKILSRKVAKYSYGEKMRLLLLAASLSRYPIVILDEIDKGLDIKNLKIVHSYLNEMSKDRLVICCSHLKKTEDASSNIMFEDGKLHYQKKAIAVVEKLHPDFIPFNSKRLLNKALMSNTIVIFFAILTLAMSVLSIQLFTGSFYKRIDISRETGFDYASISQRFDSDYRRGIHEEDVAEFGDKAVPDYFSFTYDVDTESPPIYFEENDAVYFFSGYYFDVDILPSIEIDINPTEDFTIYPNEIAVASMKEAFNLSYDRLKALPLSFDWFGKDNEANKDVDINFDVKLGKIIKDTSQLGDSKIYYSGRQFKNAMKNYTTEVDGVTHQLLDHIGKRGSNTSLSFKKYVTLFDQSQLEEYKKNTNLSFLNEGIKFLLPITHTYLKAIEGKQVNSILFSTLGYVTMGLTALTMIFGYFLIRRKTMKSFLFLTVLGYKRRFLWTYYANVLFGPFVLVSCTLVFLFFSPLIYQMLCLAGILAVLIVLHAYSDSKRACSLLVGTLKTAGIA